MQDLLANPAVQSGVLPFVIAMMAGLLLKRLGWYWAGLAITAGFTATVYFTAGFQFNPWTSTRKIIALGYAAVVLGVLLDIYPWSRRWLPPLLFVAAGASALWLVWPVLQRREGLDLWLLAAGSVVYVGWCAAAMESLRSKSVHAVGAAVTLGFGTGGVVLLGASALLGQLGLALGSAAGALWLLASFTRNTEVGSLAMFPAGMLLGLLGIGGHVYSNVPWYSLAMLALAPACAQIPLSSGWPRWMQALMTSFLSGAPAGIAVWLVYRVAGGVPL